MDCFYEQYINIEITVNTLLIGTVVNMLFIKHINFFNRNKYVSG